MLVVQLHRDSYFHASQQFEAVRATAPVPWNLSQRPASCGEHFRRRVANKSEKISRSAAVTQQVLGSSLKVAVPVSASTVAFTWQVLEVGQLVSVCPRALYTSCCKQSQSVSLHPVPALVRTVRSRQMQENLANRIAAKATILMSRSFSSLSRLISTCQLTPFTHARQAPRAVLPVLCWTCLAEVQFVYSYVLLFSKTCAGTWAIGPGFCPSLRHGQVQPEQEKKLEEQPGAGCALHSYEYLLSGD